MYSGKPIKGPDPLSSLVVNFIFSNVSKYAVHAKSWAKIGALCPTDKE